MQKAILTGTDEAFDVSGSEDCRTNLANITEVVHSTMLQRRLPFLLGLVGFQAIQIIYL